MSVPATPHAGSFWLAFALFLIAWQAMIVAMMLPSSLPLVRLFNRRVFRRTGPRTGDARVPQRLRPHLDRVRRRGVRRRRARSPPDRGQRRATRARRSIIVAGLLALAGAVQFTPLKDRCLTECRHPGAFLMRHYRRGTSGGFTLGRRHGLFCLGCCWALMLVMFVAGVASLICMGGAHRAHGLREDGRTRRQGSARQPGSRCWHWRPSSSSTHTGCRRRSEVAAEAPLGRGPFRKSAQFA